LTDYQKFVARRNWRTNIIAAACGIILIVSLILFRLDRTLPIAGLIGFLSYVLITGKQEWLYLAAGDRNISHSPFS
jgi:EamA domain-containing membrane protein RarD